MAGLCFVGVKCYRCRISLMKYLCDPHVIPTNTCPPDAVELAKRSAEFTSFATMVQLDIADGNFAPVVSWPYFHGQKQELDRMGASGECLPHSDALQYEIHMMVREPGEVGTLLARAGAHRLVPHIEAFENTDAARRAFAAWKAAGAQEIGLAILIDTPLEALDALIGEIDVVQVMSIAKIGRQGEPFDERALHRVEELHAQYPDLMVSVDGGISEANVELLVRAGANRLCVGSAISKAANPAAAFAKIHERAMLGCAPQTLETLQQ